MVSSERKQGDWTIRMLKLQKFEDFDFSGGVISKNDQFNHGCSLQEEKRHSRKAKQAEPEDQHVIISLKGELHGLL